MSTDASRNLAMAALSAALALPVFAETPATPPAAGNPFVRSGSIGQKVDATRDCPTAAFAFRPLSCWAGQKFIVLPKPKSRQKAGYGAFKPGKYEDLVGHVMTVTALEQSATKQAVKLKDDATSKEYTLSFGSDETIADLALLADLQAARDKWLGKTLWLLQPNLIAYDEPADSYSTVKAPRFSGGKVTDVVAGWDSHLPVRLILQTADGQEGYRDVNVSGTNIRETSRDDNRFDDFFTDTDPKVAHNWPPKVWDSITAREVFVGMTTDQVRLSWGKPNSTTHIVASGKARDEWVYTSGILSFEDNVLTVVKK
jgi:hypothetical protein